MMPISAIPPKTGSGHFARTVHTVNQPDPEPALIMAGFWFGSVNEYLENNSGSWETI